MLQTLSHKQALADGVLDRRGNLSEIKLHTGRQAFLAKLEQLVSSQPQSAPAQPAASKVLPADRALGFAQEARQRINGALVRCEERYPQQGDHSVLYLVVERDATEWRERLGSLHQEYFGPGQSDPLAPVRMEVIDRATDEALQRLIELGLVSKTSRGSRPLFPLEDTALAAMPLSDAEREKAAAHRQQAQRKLKMARLLGEGDLSDEARAALLEAVLPLGRALAIEGRLPEPATLEDALLPPLAHHWRETLTPLRQFAGNAAAPWRPVVECLSAL